MTNIGITTLIKPHQLMLMGFKWLFFSNPLLLGYETCEFYNDTYRIQIRATATVLASMRSSYKYLLEHQSEDSCAQQMIIESPMIEPRMVIIF